MFDAEKLLSKVVHEVTGSKGSKYSKKKKKKKKKYGNPLVDNLKSGAGLMTAIGLGIGAYEILKSNKSQPTSPGHQPYQQPQQSTQPVSPPPVPPAQPAQGGATPPPPPTPGSSQPEQVAVQPPVNLSTNDLAIRMIQVMIAAAHADGTMDEQEEKAILDRLKAENLSKEESMFLLTELHSPKPIVDLTEGITDPATAKAMYMLAVSAIEIDTEEERQWLDQLGSKLNLSPTIQSFIEEQI